MIVTHHRLDWIGRREVGTLGPSTTQKLFSSVGGNTAPARRAVALANCDPAAEIFVAMVSTGGAAPTLSTSEHDWILMPRSQALIPVGPGIDLYVRSSSTANVAYVATELG